MKGADEAIFYLIHAVVNYPLNDVRS